MAKSASKAKTLEDWKLDITILYDEVRDKTTDIKTAGELANIAGKGIKIEALQLAREMFMLQLGRTVIVPQSPAEALTHAT